MRLWTFQSIKAVKELIQHKKLIAKWDRYNPKSRWTTAYRWMAAEMKRKGIDCKGTAPIWAWHTCEGDHPYPTLDDARALLSDCEIEGGIQTIEFECPDHLVLLTSYDSWGGILDHFLDGHSTNTLNNSDIEAMYKLDAEYIEEYPTIQATFPYLCLDWVIDIRDLNLKPDDPNYDPNERV